MDTVDNQKTYWIIAFVALFLLTLVGLIILLTFFLVRKKNYNECKDDRDELEKKLKYCCSQFKAGGNPYCEGYSVVKPPTGKPVDEDDDEMVGQPVPDDNNDFVNPSFQ